MIRCIIIIINCVIISNIFLQELLYDKNTSGPAIGFNILNSGDNDGFGADIEYIFSGRHAPAFARSKNVTVVSFGVGVSINAILP